MTKARFVLLSILALFVLAGEAVATTSALAVEAPYWSVNGKRLGAGENRKVTIKNVTGSETTLNGLFGEAKVEIKCKSMESRSMELKGSTKSSDGTAAGEVELSGCKLTVGGVEQPSCEVAPIKTGTMNGQLWYDGPSKAAGETIDLVYEPKEEKEKHLVLAEITINGCAAAGKFKLENRIALQITPEDSESTEATLSPSPNIHVWQPQFGGMEIQVQPEFASNPATLKLKATAKLASGEKFGVFNK